MTEYRLAEEVREVANPLISEHHPHLLGAKVVWVFVNKTPKSKGREVWGRTKKISGLAAFLVFAAAVPELAKDWPHDGDREDFFAVEIPEEAWRKLTARGRKALVENQLHRMQIDEDEETGAVSLAVVGPDVAEFEAVVRRYGAWHDSLHDFVEAGAEQLSLDEAVDDLREMGATVSMTSERAREVARGTGPVPGQTESFSFSGEDSARLGEAARHLRTVGEVDPETGGVLEGARS